MDNDREDTVLPLGNATVVLPPGVQRQRFRVDTAILTPRGRRRVRLTFDGPRGSVSVELPRVTFWSLTSRFHEQSAAADFGGPKQPGRRARGKRR